MPPVTISKRLMKPAALASAILALGACSSYDDDYYSPYGYGYDYDRTYDGRDRYDPAYRSGIDAARSAHARYSEYRAEELDGNCERVVTVVRGDTLSDIAEYCDVPVRAILAENRDIYNPRSLRVGERIRIPAVRGTVYEGTRLARAADYDRPAYRDTLPPARYSRDEVDVYTVRPGDTLSEIADYYGVSVGTLRQLNPGVYARSLDVGQPIYVPANQRFTPRPRRAPHREFGPRAEVIDFAPVVSVEPARGPRDREIVILAEDLPPNEDVWLLIGDHHDRMQQWRRITTGADGRYRAPVRLPSDYRAEQVYFGFSPVDRDVMRVGGQYDIVAAPSPAPRRTTLDRGVERDRSLLAGLLPNRNANFNGKSLDSAPAATIVGILTDEGVNCPSLRDDAGNLYSLLGDLEGFDDGDRVLVNGSVQADDRLCAQAETVQVWSVRAAPW